ncbi:tRNA modification GTPase MnmE [compost metagenome]
MIDTAGLRDSPDVNEVEKIGIARAWGQIQGADAVLFLHDLTRCHLPAYQADDAAIAAALPADVTVLQVWNKVDQVDATTRAALEPRLLHGDLVLSAKQGDGLEALRQRLLTLAGWQHAGDGLFMARERHLQALQRVGAHLDGAATWLSAQAEHLDLLAEELRLAQHALGEITGEFSADDLLGEIFSRFCIGK